MRSDVGLGLLFCIAGIGLGFFFGAVATPFLPGSSAIRIEETGSGPVAEAHAAAAQLRRAYRNDRLEAEIAARAAVMRRRHESDVVTGSIRKGLGIAASEAEPAP
jgi:hypothetical protein